MDSSEPIRRNSGDANQLRRSFPLRLTPRQHRLLLQASAAENRSRQSLLVERLAAFFSDLERRFPDGAESSDDA